VAIEGISSKRMTMKCKEATEDSHPHAFRENPDFQNIQFFSPSLFAGRKDIKQGGTDKDKQDCNHNSMKHTESFYP
jgi:hypothetical protein